jgi:very-short-patch-repair endonuclease
MAFPKEKLGVYVFSGEPDTSKDAKLQAAGWTIIRFDAAEVSDGKKEAEVIIDYLAELEPAEPTFEEPEPVEPETIVLGPDFSNLDLGIEPETVETPVRRTAYNMGLRFRRKYGPYKIPVAFVSCKVAVYVTDGVPEDENDAALKEDGWTILRFDGAEVTDGKKEAEIIAAQVKEATRAQKAAAAKAKKAKARKAAKKN